MGRDINGVAVAGNASNAVFLYDDVLNVTWLRNANANGPMDWTQANAWAANLVVGAYEDWRLPTMIATPDATLSNAGGTDLGSNVRTKDGIATQFQAGQTVFSEMAHLWYSTLGNKSICPPGNASCSGPGAPQPGWGLTNTGNFQNLLADYYWIGLEYAPDPGQAWIFLTFSGEQLTISKPDGRYAMAVRDGDVAPSAVPIPAALPLLLSGLAPLLFAAKRRTLRPARQEA